MIRSKKDYQYYLEADRIALGIKKGIKDNIKQFVAPNYCWKFQKKLRKLEYFKNCKKSMLGRVRYQILRLSYKKLSLKLGFSIPTNVFGPGLAIVHYGTIVVNKAARIGENCRIHVCTNIGASAGKKEAPQIGDNVYIGPGVKIYGDITIGNNIAIGANSTVNKSFTEDNVIIAGSPARKIRDVN